MKRPSTTYFSDCKTLGEIKKKYYKLALIHHPDKGGDEETMKAINLEYEYFSTQVQFDAYTEAEKSSYIIYPEIISQIINFSNITVEACGSWLWLSGATFIIRKELKEIGFRWAPHKYMWYFRPEHDRTSNPKPWSIEKIRSKYGSEQIKSTNQIYQLS